MIFSSMKKMPVMFFAALLIVYFTSTPASSAADNTVKDIVSSAGETPANREMKTLNSKTGSQYAYDVAPTIEEMVETKEGVLLNNLKEQEIVSVSGKTADKGNSGINIGNKKRFTPGGLKNNDPQVKAAAGEFQKLIGELNSPGSSNKGPARAKKLGELRAAWGRMTPEERSGLKSAYPKLAEMVEKICASGNPPAFKGAFQKKK